jgi:16S rRNA (cytosine967-C5)-methyltransferase
MAAAADNERRVSWLVLKHFEPDKHNTAELIEKYCGKKCNRPAVIEITSGVIRNSVFIDGLIAQVSGQAVKRISKKIIDCLRIGVYELIFCNQADYAVVNEAVNLAREIGSKKSAGFVNAVLRKVCSSIKNKSADLNTAEPKKTLPIGPKSGCEFNIDILPDANSQKGQYLSGAFSLPLWLIEQWLTEFGYEKTLDICFASNRRPSIYARANRLKLTAQKLFETLKSQGVDCELVSAGCLTAEKYKMVKLNKSGNISELKAFKEGLFTIQDITSSLVVPFLDPQPGWQVFDICAAPGTKTTQIAELMEDTGCIIATDKDPARLIKIAENVQRLNITSVKIMDYKEFCKESAGQASADAVLLDVPCSNSGVLARRPEVRYRLNANTLNSLVKTQTEILKLAAAFVRKGGRIGYSTCSILKQENSDTINAFIKENPEFKLEKENLFLPSAGSCDYDGGYAAILLKK